MHSDLRFGRRLGVSSEESLKMFSKFLQSNQSMYLTISNILVIEYLLFILYENLPMQITEIFKVVKKVKFSVEKSDCFFFFLFFSEHTLRVHVRTASP